MSRLLVGILVWGSLIARCGFLCHLQAAGVDLSSTGALQPVHKIKVQSPAPASLVLPSDVRLVANYGSFQLYETTQLSPELTAHPAVELRDEYNQILLHAVHLDTTQPATRAKRQALMPFAGKRLHLVQFAGPIQPAWYDELLSCGIKLVAYIPHNAYLVYGNAPALARVQTWANGAAQVQWEASYLAEYKVHPAARPYDLSGRPRSLSNDLFALQIVADPENNPGTLQLLEQLKLEPFRRLETFYPYRNIVARVLPADLERIAAQPDVISIQPYASPRKFCERQDQIVAGNISGNLLLGPGYLAWLTSKGFTQTQFDTADFLVDITDSGIDNGTTLPNHFGLYAGGDTLNPSRVAYSRVVGTPNVDSTLKGCDGHGTVNAHIVGGYDDFAGFPFADNSGYHYGLGVCPFVKVGASVVFDPDNFTSPNYAELESLAYQDHARISNNSWGGSSDVYDLDAQIYDALVRDAQPDGTTFANPGNQEMVLVFPAGNDGPAAHSVTSPGTAKNVICVGAGENIQRIGGRDGSSVGDSDADSANDIASFSSRGPTADGRHKPDLMAPGTHVSGGIPQASHPALAGTADACYTGDGVSGGLGGSHFFPAGQEFYTVSSGTSHATPAVSGGCALLRQYFLNQFSNPPSPAMTKACLMNAARYMTGSSANDSLWSDTQGLGELDLGTAFDSVPRLMRDQVDLFTHTGETRVFTGVIAAPGQPFRVTLAWTDAPGSTTAAAYNNDLDLTVTVGGQLYKGNVFSGPFSISGGLADAVDNVESVFLPPGSSGSFVVKVTAANINSDGVPNNANALDQDFALVIYNAYPDATTPPSITRQPLGQTVPAGTNLNMQVVAAGSPPLSYQWFFQGAALRDGAVESLLLTNVHAAQMGAYFVVVTNPAGSVTSAVAQLRVLVPPEITQVRNAGAKFEVMLLTVPGLQYRLEYKDTLADAQWSRISIPVTGNGGALSLSDTNLTSASRFYRVLCE